MISGTGQPGNAGDKTEGLSPNPPLGIALPTLQESLRTTAAECGEGLGKEASSLPPPLPDSPPLRRTMCSSCKA